MRRVIHLVICGAAVLLPAVASADGFEVRAGAFFPNTGKRTSADCKTGCNLFGDLEELFGVAKKDGWAGATGGIEFNKSVASTVELGLHIDGYSRRRWTHYVGNEVPRGLEQKMDYTFVPIGVSVRLIPTGKRSAVAPYVAAGIDMVIWDFREHGDFYDFTSGDVNHARLKASGVTPGLHVAAGVRVPLSYDFALTGEARYLWTSKVAMGGDFVNGDGQSIYDIQPGGVSATLGLNMRF
jgi:hypothetical protein